VGFRRFNFNSDDEAVAIVRKSLQDNPGNAALAASILRDCAFICDSSDNITVIVLILLS
jgi:hypothetical protein